MEQTLLQKAIEFAVERHAGAVRKGTDIPYIVHPVEVMKITAQLTADEEVRAAAVLHDTVEDTETTIEEIEALFGGRVKTLVAAESENKRKDQKESDTWQIRKQETLDHIAGAECNAKIICLGDKLANVRDIARDYRVLGDALWSRFNAPEQIELGEKDRRFGGKKRYCGKRSVIGWYYRGIADRLQGELGGTDAWKEYDRLVRSAFEE